MKARANGTIKTFYILHSWRRWHAESRIDYIARIYGAHYDINMSKL